MRAVPPSKAMHMTVLRATGDRQGACPRQQLRHHLQSTHDRVEFLELRSVSDRRQLAAHART